jgi:hypothetical protein
MKTLAMFALALFATGCSLFNPAPGIDPPPLVERKPLLTPIPGVSTTERLLAIAECSRGLRAAGLSVAAMEDAADETTTGEAAKSSAAVAMKVLDQAQQQGVARDTLKACGQMLDNAAKARATRDEAIQKR